MIHFYENRQVTPALVGEAFKNENRALVEVAKIALSPSAIQYLRESMTVSMAAHEAGAGKMLTPAEYDKRIGEYLNKSLVDSAERLLKPPDQDPSS